MNFRTAERWLCLHVRPADRAYVRSGGTFIVALRGFNARVAELERLAAELERLAAELERAKKQVTDWCGLVEIAGRAYAREKDRKR